ncbi:MAG: nitroreductase [Ilumatobacteraceae bacterium]|nr:nitroreductase [Ilumatobacteraceae bacterium]
MTPEDPQRGGFAQLARSRRTSMVVDKEVAVPRATVEQLCELAQWAPNHKRTWPWRFAVADGEGRARLGNTIADAMELHGDPQQKIAKARTKYLRTPSVLVVGSAAGDSATRTAENRDAVAAGVQNILLAATSIGLASFWSSCPRGANDAVAELCGFDLDTHVAALIYLGWATETSAAPERPPVTLNVVD